MANLTQLRYRVASLLDELGTHAMFSQAEIARFLNDAQQAGWHVLRESRKDWFRTKIRSTDASLTILGASYAPSSLQLVSGTNEYTLPGDVSEIKRIRVTTANRQNVLFSASDEADPTFIEALVQSEQQVGWLAQGYLWDVTAEKLLVLSPIPRETLDIEVLYTRMLPDLAEYGTGTLIRTNGSAIYVGTSTAWTSNAIVVTKGSEIVVGATTTGTSGIDPNAQYPVVNTVTDDTHITFEQSFTGTTDASGQSYLISSVPQIPRSYHAALVAYAVELGKAKDRSQDKTYWDALAQRLFGTMTTGVEVRQTADPEYARTYLEGY